MYYLVVGTNVLFPKVQTKPKFLTEISPKVEDRI